MLLALRNQSARLWVCNFFFVRFSSLVLLTILMPFPAHAQLQSDGNVRITQHWLDGEQIVEGDQFGRILETGDFNCDGYKDLAIGVPLKDITDSSGRQLEDAGTVNIIYGPVGLNVSSKRQVWRIDSIGTINQSAAAGDKFGAALATGNFDSDFNSVGGYSCDDLAIGAPDKYPGGRVVILYGSPAGLQSLDEIWAQDSEDDRGDQLSGSSEDGDQFGAALASGDFNCDNYSDLAIGVPGEDFHNELGIFKTDAGAVNILYGSADHSASRNSN